jgi:two-component system, LytTR family, sensor kinase
MDGACAIRRQNAGMSPRARLLPWLAYAAFWLGVGLFFSLAEWQHYMRAGGMHPWEPFLWEMSGALSSGVLAVAVYRFNDWLLARHLRLAARIAAYLAGALAFAPLHSALMFGMRYAVYGLAGMRYDPGNLRSVLSYESAKDVVSYALVLGLAMGWRSFQREQRQAAEVERLNAHLAEARLARLQEQIQPHFLFNTLNLISSVMHEDVERADRILAELADLLRQSMRASEVAEHTLAQEMRWVEPFLSIMRQRFGERLRAQVAVSEAAGGCIVPTLLLMAPVENAVKHGVARSSAGAQVEVVADVVDGQLCIDIVDTGDAGVEPSAGGTGLANARARLATLYGDAAAITLQRQDGRTRVRVTLPARARAGA